jgi:hypothetical protein
MALRVNLHMKRELQKCELQKCEVGDRQCPWGNVEGNEFVIDQHLLNLRPMKSRKE